MNVPEEYFVARVERLAALSPVMRRVVLGGPHLQHYRSTGVADEWFRFLFPADGQGRVDLPTKVHGHWRLSPRETLSRWYTVRQWDVERGEVTVDVVLHGHGAAARWAALAEPGDEVVISSPAGRYAPPSEAGWELVVADVTGLPAAGRIMAELSPGRRVLAVLEVPDQDCVLPLPTSGDLEVSWIFNASPGKIPSGLDAATRDLHLPAGPGYVWMAGEASCSRQIRRYFRHELKWPSTAYDISGYWRPQSEVYSRRYAEIEGQVTDVYAQSSRAGRDPEETADEVFSVMEQHGL